ncbi:MAG: DUF5610 domain-containing protein [Methyloprofundus sp.]|nr:DUF5610 domain-containing protein [Methyloprofundus sp.]MDT8424368.1 DUF5610 domain-containing protein [Methyloprofundus sp.]
MDIKSFSQDVRSLPRGDDNRANKPRGQEVSQLAHTRNAERKELNSPDKIQDSAATIVKKQMNAQILASAVKVSVSAGDQPLSLVLKTALEGINEALKETMGDNAIQNSYDAGLDVTPEATAGRIVSLSTAFFGKYQEMHPDLSQEDALTSFTDIISGGIDKGFAEARDILDGLDVLKGDIATNIDKTYALVQDGLKSFVDNYGQAVDTEVFDS